LADDIFYLVSLEEVLILGFSWRK